jgi:hypothetical protein
MLEVAGRPDQIPAPSSVLALWFTPRTAILPTLEAALSAGRDLISALLVHRSPTSSTSQTLFTSTLCWAWCKGINCLDRKSKRIKCHKPTTAFSPGFTVNLCLSVANLFLHESDPPFLALLAFVAKIAHLSVSNRYIALFFLLYFFCMKVQKISSV